MQFPESWLREYCNPNLTTQQLADTLTMAGLEVEELDPVAPPFTGIVVGEIVNVCADECVLDENGKIDTDKVNPIVFDSVAHTYRKLGEKVGTAFSDGNQLK